MKVSSQGFLLNLLFLLIFAACGQVSLRQPSSEQLPEIQDEDCAEDSTSDESSAEVEIISPNHLSEESLDWPVDTARLSRGFSLKPTGKRRKPHYGIDLAAAKGTSIFSAQDGIVIYAGHEFKGFGRVIMIEGESGFATLYAHLSKIKVKQGQKVTRGMLIGAMGRTGRASGVHLHFEIRKDRIPVNPLLYLPNSQVAAGR